MKAAKAGLVAFLVAAGLVAATAFVSGRALDLPLIVSPPIMGAVAGLIVQFRADPRHSGLHSTAPEPEA